MKKKLSQIQLVQMKAKRESDKVRVRRVVAAFGDYEKGLAHSRRMVEKRRERAEAIRWFIYGNVTFLGVASVVYLVCSWLKI